MMSNVIQNRWTARTPMSKALLIGGCVCWTAIGAALMYWSYQLSLPYNACPTRLQEQHPEFNPPPTSQMREWVFRFLGATFLLLSILLSSGVWNSN